MVSEAREKQLLEIKGTAETAAEGSKIYKKKIQEESLHDTPEYLKYIYVCSDYLGLTTPDQRLEKRIKESDASCVKQRVLISQYEKRIKKQEELIVNKEAELRDSVFCYEKRKSAIEETSLKIEALEEEKQDLRQKRVNPEIFAKIDGQLISLNQQLRKYEREKNEFAARIIEVEAFAREAENVLVSVQVYSSALHRNYLRSRIERMRLAPLIGFGKRPIETIDLILEDQKIAENTARLADAMTLWVGEITDQVAEMEITSPQGVYSDLNKKHSSSNNDIASLAEKIIEEKSKGRYVR